MANEIDAVTRQSETVYKLFCRISVLATLAVLGLLGLMALFLL